MRRTTSGKPGKAQMPMKANRAATSKAARNRPSTALGKEQEVARLARERDEALEREKATAEVLQVIASSPGELAPVFDAMLENATRICGAECGLLYRLEGRAFRVEAQKGVSPEFVEFIQQKAIEPAPGTVLGRILASKQIINIADLESDPAYLERNPVLMAAVKAGHRSTLGLPILKRIPVILKHSLHA